MTDFTPDADWLSPHPDPRTPSFAVPAGAVDAHCHVFGPGDIFPYAPERKYTPTDAPAEALFALRDRLGFSRSVIVQATCHGTDNRALVDALRRSHGTAKGVVSVAPSVTDDELDEMHEAGVRGIRFNFVTRLADPGPDAPYRVLAERVAERGWHVVVYFEPAELQSRAELLRTLPAPIVIDHMGRPDVSQSIDGPGFTRLFALLDERQDAWVKATCPERLSAQGPPYDDVIPFARRVVETFPDRVLWGTDWPHPNMRSHMPDDGDLVDTIPRIAVTADLQQRLLVENPRRLYWPEEA